MSKLSLYIGTQTEKQEGVEYIPLIETIAKPFDSFAIKHQFADMEEYTHIIFTSKNAVEIFFEALNHFGYPKSVLDSKVLVCIGKVTMKALKAHGIKEAIVSQEATQEGLIRTLSFLDLKNAYILLPRSSRARLALCSALRRWGVRMQICHIYDTKIKIPKTLPDLNKYSEVIFSSPSTIDAFKSIFTAVPKNLKLKSIGPITESYLKEKLFDLL